MQIHNERIQERLSHNFQMLYSLPYQRAVRDRVKDFSMNLKAINLRKIATQPKNENKGTKELSKREKALLFAQRIPRPKASSPTKQLSNATSSTLIADDVSDSQRPDSGEDSTIWKSHQKEEHRRLRELEAEYENNRGEMEAMQKAFGLLGYK